MPTSLCGALVSEDLSDITTTMLGKRPRIRDGLVESLLWDWLESLEKHLPHSEKGFQQAEVDPAGICGAGMVLSSCPCQTTNPYGLSLRQECTA